MVLRELLARFGIDFDSKGLESGTAKLEQAIGSVKQLGAVLAGSAVAVGVTAFVGQMVEMGSELDLASQRIGLSARELLGWRHAAALAGVEAENMDETMATLAERARDASTGSQELQAIFRRLGVTLKGPDGQLRNINDLMLETSAAIGGLDNETEKVAITLTLLGDEARKLLPMFNRGAGGINAMRNEVEGLVGSSFEEFLNQTKEAKANMARWNLAMLGVKTTIAVEILPRVTALLRGAIDLIRGFKALSERTRIVKVGLAAVGLAAAAVGVAMLIAFAKPLIIVGLIAAAIGIVVLVVDDLIAMFTGGRSVIAGFLDEMFGIGTAKTVVETLTRLWENFVTGIRVTGNVIGWFYDVFTTVVGRAASYWSETWGPTFGKYGKLIRGILALTRSIAGIIKNVWTRVARSIRFAFEFAFQEIANKAKSVAGRFGIDLEGIGNLVAGAIDFGNRAVAGGVGGGVEMATRAVQAGTLGAQVVEANTQVGQIVVNGTADPEETARRVVGIVEERQNSSLRAARANLAEAG